MHTFETHRTELLLLNKTTRVTETNSYIGRGCLAGSTFLSFVVSGQGPALSNAGPAGLFVRYKYFK